MRPHSEASRDARVCVATSFDNRRILVKGVVGIEFPRTGTQDLLVRLVFQGTVQGCLQRDFVAHGNQFAQFALLQEFRGTRKAICAESKASADKGFQQDRCQSFPF